MRCLFSCVAFIFVLFESLPACTAFHLHSKDGAHLYCRTMEYGFPLHSNLLIVPRLTEFTGTSPHDLPGLKWSAQYGFVGMNQAIARRLVTDGMNEKGLVVGSLYLARYAEYERPEKGKSGETLASWELPSFLLSTCQSVEEVKKTIATVIVAEQKMPQTGKYILPLHFYVCDAKGERIVIEYVDGVRNVYDNPIGVLTNAPPFDWQLLNLTNYMNVSSINIPEFHLDGYAVENSGQGSGMMGLPGDATPPSRFIRAAFYAEWATKTEKAVDAVRLGFHILNTFDLFEGLIKSKKESLSFLNARAKISLNVHNSDMTEWVIVHDMTNLKTYFRNYDSLQIQMIDLKTVDFDRPALRQMPLSKDLVIEAVSDWDVNLPVK